MSNPYDTGNHKKASVLGPTLKFKGDLTANEDLLIQGKVEGSIKHTSNLTIGVEGQVSGDLQGSKSVVVKDTANIQGNIYSPTVSLHEGSTFNGKIDMTGKEQSQAATPKVTQAVPVPGDNSDTSKPEAVDKKPAVTRKRSASAA